MKATTLTGAISPSRTAFAITMIALALLSVRTGDFAPIFNPIPKNLAGRELMIWTSAVIAGGCGLGILLQPTSRLASWVLLAFLTLWTAVFKLPFIIREPLVEVGYQSAGENIVLITAAWVLAIRSADAARSQAAAGIPRPAFIIYGLSLIAFGLSHFVYVELTAPLVPAWLTHPVFWAYLTGFIYLVAGAMLVAGIHLFVAATLAAIQITLITVLVWTPVIVAGNLTAMHQQEVVVSWVLMVAAWVVACSLRNPWSRLAMVQQAPNFDPA